MLRIFILVSAEMIESIHKSCVYPKNCLCCYNFCFLQGTKAKDYLPIQLALYPECTFLTIRSLNFSFLFVFAIWISWRFPSFICKHFLPSVYLLLTFDSKLQEEIQVTHSTLFAWKYSQKNMQVRCLPVLLFIEPQNEIQLSFLPSGEEGALSPISNNMFLSSSWEFNYQWCPYFYGNFSWWYRYSL